VKVEPNDVDVNRSWMRSSGRGGRVARTSRAVGLQTGNLELIHMPTGARVKGLVPEGNYTRKQMSNAMDQLHLKLLSELQDTVDQQLRKPGK
jgi:protein subunit release factor A